MNNLQILFLVLSICCANAPYATAQTRPYAQSATPALSSGHHPDAPHQRAEETQHAPLLTSPPTKTMPATPAASSSSPAQQTSATRPETSAPEQPLFLDANAIFHRQHTENMCVLSFDDGPGPYTPQLLDALREENVPAIFFVLGNRVALYPDLIKRMLAEGHEVGSHSYSHPNLRRKSKDVQRIELEKTDALLRELGVQPKYFRPPYGNSTPFVRQLAASMGMAVVLWTADSLDWKRCPSDYRKIDGATCNGRMRGVFLFHDIQKHTVDDLHRIVRELREGGCERFVTLTEYMEGRARLKALSPQDPSSCPVITTPEQPQSTGTQPTEDASPQPVQEIILPITPPQPLSGTTVLPPAAPRSHTTGTPGETSPLAAPRTAHDTITPDNATQPANAVPDMSPAAPASASNLKTEMQKQWQRVKAFFKTLFSE